jgi:hypothetical protein
MKTPPLQVDDAPRLSAEAAVQCLDFLYALINAFENHYVSELLQAQYAEDDLQQDLFIHHHTACDDDRSF